jgi:hypothetical protein
MAIMGIMVLAQVTMAEEVEIMVLAMAEVEGETMELGDEDLEWEGGDQIKSWEEINVSTVGKEVTGREIVQDLFSAMDVVDKDICLLTAMQKILPESQLWIITSQD